MRRNVIESRKMKIGVISDTHLKRPTPLLEKVTEEYFSDIDLVVHCGDLVSMEVLEASKGKEVVAVSGNTDYPEVRRKLPEKQTLTAGRFKIGVIHGRGPSIGLAKRIASSFEGVSCLVYGHSHRPSIHHFGGVLYFNPGAFSRGISSLWRCSIGLLTITQEIRAEILRW